MTPPRTGPTTAPLTGFTVAVTAARRADEITALLQRKGAHVITAPALRIVALGDDRHLAAISEQLVRHPADIVVVTTGIGFRGWIEACDTWGSADRLLASLRTSHLLTRGPKATGAIRAAGLTEHWSPPGESCAEILDHLLTRGVQGLRVAVQLHGRPLPDLTDALRLAGAEVVEIPVYRWRPPTDTDPLDRLIDTTIAGGVDALTFTSAPAADGLLSRAADTGRTEALLEALRHDVLAMCVGPTTAHPLTTRAVPARWPRRARVGAQVRALAHELPARFPTLHAAGHRLRLRGHAVIVDGTARTLSPTLMRLMRALAHRPGQVHSRAHLLTCLGPGSAPHAVETAVARLRTALGDPRIVHTVVKRGYRLALDTPPAL